MLINFLFSVISFIFHENLHYFFESGDRLAQVEQGMGWEGSLAELPWQDFSDVSC